MTPDHRDDDQNAKVISLRYGAIPPLTAAARSGDTCISCGDPELVTEDLCADCLAMDPAAWPEGWPYVLTEDGYVITGKG